MLIAIVALAAGTIVVSRQKAETKRQRRGRRAFPAGAHAVDEMLTELGAKHLADIPQMVGVRRAMLEKALAFHEQFLREQNDATTQHDAGMAFQRRLDPRHARPVRPGGRGVSARSSCSNARWPKPRGTPTAAGTWRLHSKTWVSGIRNEGRPLRAMEFEEQSISLLEKLANKFPDRTVYHDLLAGPEQQPGDGVIQCRQGARGGRGRSAGGGTDQGPRSDFTRGARRKIHAYGSLGNMLGKTRSFTEAKAALRPRLI